MTRPVLESFDIREIEPYEPITASPRSFSFSPPEPKTFRVELVFLCDRINLDALERFLESQGASVPRRGWGGLGRPRSLTAPIEAELLDADELPPRRLGR